MGQRWSTVPVTSSSCRPGTMPGWSATSVVSSLTVPASRNTPSPNNGPRSPDQRVGADVDASALGNVVVHGHRFPRQQEVAYAQLQLLVGHGRAGALVQ